MAKSKRPHQLNHSVKVKGPKSGDKIKNTIKHFQKLRSRITTEGETLWIKNAREIVLVKLRKYSINPNSL